MMFNITDMNQEFEKFNQQKKETTESKNLLQKLNKKYPRFRLKPKTNENIQKFKASNGKKHLFSSNIVLLDDIKENETLLEAITSNKVVKRFEFEFFDEQRKYSEKGGFFNLVLPIKSLEDPNFIEVDKLVTQAGISNFKADMYMYFSIYNPTAYYDNKKNVWVPQRQVLRLNDRNGEAFNQKLEVVDFSVRNSLRGLYLTMEREGVNTSPKTGIPVNVRSDFNGNKLERVKQYIHMTEEQMVTKYGHDEVKSQDGKITYVQKNERITPFDFTKELLPMSLDEIAKALQITSVAGSGATGVTNFLSADDILAETDNDGVDSILNDMEDTDAFMDELTKEV